MDLSKNEIQILALAYVCGKGYCTALSIHKYCKYTEIHAQRILNGLKDKDYLKVIKIDKCYVYVLKKASFALLEKKENGPYLERMKSRNEDESLIIDKLKMLSYILDPIHSKQGLEFIHQVDKVNILLNDYHALESDIDIFKVKPGNQYQFNDVQYSFENTLCITLFPRNEVYAKTYIRDFLIKQYYLLNYRLFNSSIKLVFKILVYNQERQSHFINEIEDGVIRMYKRDTVDSDVINYLMNEQQNSVPRRLFTESEIPVSSNLFDIEVLYTEPQHTFFT